MVALEYKLIGNEFKILQFLKTVDEPISQADMSIVLNINTRTIRMSLQSLREKKVIVSEKVERRGKYPSKYFVNNIDLWELGAYTTRKFRNEVDRLVKAEEIKNGIEQRT